MAAWITVIGNLGGNPESKDVGSSKVCNFSIAHNRKYKGEESTDWYEVAAWGKLGEICQEHLVKGSQVAVAGELEQRAYTTKDGTDRISLDIRANSMQFVGAKPDGAAAKSEPKPATNDEDDIPF